MATTRDDGMILLTLAEAVERLPDGDRIHTFRAGPILVGADWERAEILTALESATEIHETGEQAQSMGHGIAILDRTSWLFIEARGPR